MAASRKFFDERKGQSEVKARIVSKYFVAWANVILPSVIRASGRLAYIDLYAGPGRYKDGAVSTPLMVLKVILTKPNLFLRSRLSTRGVMSDYRLVL